MTGRFPLHVQEQNGKYWSENTGPPLNMTFMPEKLRSVGYATHHAGKWHLGSANVLQLPINRGFDTSLGFLDGMEDHLNHRMGGCYVNGTASAGLSTFDAPGSNWGCWGNAIPIDTCIEIDCYKNCPDDISFDLWKNQKKANVSEYDMIFSQDMYEQEIIGVVSKHNLSQPIFIYMPFQVTHSPIQPPPRLVKTYDSALFLGQRKVFAFVTAMDESIGKIIDSMKARPGMFENSLIVFSADNGGPLETMTNYPMRGGKFSDFHGGTRVAAFISGGIIPKNRRGTSLNVHIHIADWLPTFCGLASCDPIDHKAAAAGLPPVDGVNIWPQLMGQNTTEAHHELPLSNQHLFDTKTGYKIMVGDQRYNTWSPATGWPPDFVCADRNASKPLQCGSAGNPGENWGCLFNIFQDPNEHTDLASDPKFRDTLTQMQTRFNEMQERVWHNCDPPSSCQQATPDTYCAHVKSTCGGSYCPIFQ